MAFNYFHINKATKFVDNATLKLIHEVSWLTCEKPADSIPSLLFLGARNKSSTQLKLSLAAFAQRQTNFALRIV